MLAAPAQPSSNSGHRAARPIQLRGRELWTEGDRPNLDLGVPADPGLVGEHYGLGGRGCATPPTSPRRRTRRRRWSRWSSRSRSSSERLSLRSRTCSRRPRPRRRAVLGSAGRLHSAGRDARAARRPGPGPRAGGGGAPLAAAGFTVGDGRRPSRASPAHRATCTATTRCANARRTRTASSPTSPAAVGEGGYDIVFCTYETGLLTLSRSRAEIAPAVWPYAPRRWSSGPSTSSSCSAPRRPRDSRPAHRTRHREGPGRMDGAGGGQGSQPRAQTLRHRAVRLVRRGALARAGILAAGGDPLLQAPLSGRMRGGRGRWTRG